MSNPITVLAISGSLRKASYNTAVLRIAQEVAPEGVQIELYDISQIPLYNGDVEKEGTPQPVLDLRQRILEADALLIATPEYNYSISGVLKNALDWASRPPGQNPFVGKPMAIMGAGGMFGTVRAQQHLRNIAVELNALPLSKPEVMVQRPWEKFDSNLQLTDEHTRKQIHGLVTALADWTHRLSK